METGLSKIRWNKDGLIPAIVQDVDTQTVLMLAYMNEEALKLTMKERRAWYYSRSRQKLWRKGETSGNTQEVVDIKFDCDQDAVLLLVKQNGMACHENYYSCFHYEAEENGMKCVGAPNKIYSIKDELEKNGQKFKEEVKGDVINSEEQGKSFAKTEKKQQEHLNLGEFGEQLDQIDQMSLGSTLEALAQIIHSRHIERPEGSYTTYLFDKGIDKILKKVGEESAEVIIAAKNRSKSEIRYEVADLFYHVLVLLEECGVSLNEIAEELNKRRK